MGREMWIFPSLLNFVLAALFKILGGQQGHQEDGSVLTVPHSWRQAGETFKENWSSEREMALSMGDGMR